MKSEINFKKILLSNAKKRLIESLNNEINNIDTELNNSVKGMKDFLINKIKNPEITVSENTDFSEFKNKRKSLKKENYHFPDLINAGSLVNDQNIYSKIIEKNSFQTEIPMLIPVQNSGIAFLINHKYKDRINNLLEIIGIDLISALPDGLVKVTLIDKSGSGQNFPTLSGLHEKFIEGKVLSEDSEIENELADIKNSMSAIAQSISANGFESIEDYNLNTNEIPQQYNLIFINGFPNGFNKKATENLVSLIESGSKSGIYVFMSINYDPVYGLNQSINGITLDHIIKQMSTFEFSDRPHDLLTKKIIKENVEALKFPLKNEEDMKILFNTKYKMKFKEISSSELKSRIKYLNEIIKDLDLKPVIDIEKAYPPLEKFWSKDSGKGICVPFGKKGIENTYLSLGINQYGEDESTHHGLIGGSTGSGKTVLIHDIILMISMLYSPKDVQFFLLDYKEGTEFAVYKDFPYVNILSMESEIEFGHEVLDRAIKIMEDRGALFKEVGAANLLNYNTNIQKEEHKHKGLKKLPRIIIIIDEFQVLLPKDQRISSKTNEKLDRILRLGRSFGINLLLATQTLKGIDLEPQIMSNIPLRVALKMDGKDAAKIFTEENTAPRFIKNPGEGIYNKSYGNSKVNMHFQAFKAIGDSVPETMNIVQNYMKEHIEPFELEELIESRFVYNGEMEGNINNNEILFESEDKLYIGEPAGLSKEHVFVSFENNDFAENMIIVGSDQVKTASIFSYMAQQIAQKQKESKIYFFNFSLQLKQSFHNFLDKDFKENSHKIIDNKTSEIELEEIYQEYLKRKEKSEDNDIKFSKIYAFLYYIESSKLFSGASYSNKNLKKIEELLRNGPELGIHFIIYATDFTTLTENDLSRELSKFKKKIAVKGGNSLKIFGTEASVSFSKSNNVSIIDNGVTNQEYKKFKPYINNVFKLKEEE